MSDLSDWRKMQDGYRAPADCHIAPAAANERKAFMTALRIMLTSDSWGAAYGAVCEDYPEMTELVKDYKARVCCGPQKEAVQELVKASQNALVILVSLHRSVEWELAPSIKGDIADSLPNLTAALASIAERAKL
jgi:hypothetical protein